MKKDLLFVTQVMDERDGVLGAYHEWVKCLAAQVDSVTVICLFEGAHSLPANVSVYSLGKERGVVFAYRYAIRFMMLAWKLRRKYNAVLVHMNEEYVLLAGVWWRLLGKRVYMWRNHYAGTLRTSIAGRLATKVFYTSLHSYTAKMSNGVQMPVGVDLSRFVPVSQQERPRNAILFLARIAPSKRLEVFTDALRILSSRGVSYAATIVGDALPQHASYLKAQQAFIEKQGLHSQVSFIGGVAHQQTPSIFSKHAVFVNCSPSGMFDKTLFEAAAAGCAVFAVSDDFATLTQGASAFTDSESLAARLGAFLSASEREVAEYTALMRRVANAHSLECLCGQLVRELYS